MTRHNFKRHKYSAVAAVFARSADSGWTGLFAIKEDVPDDSAGFVRYAEKRGVEPKVGESMGDFMGRVRALQ